MVVLAFGELGEAIHEGDRLAKVREPKAALERAAHLVPALRIIGVGQSGHGRESYHTVSQNPEGMTPILKLVLVASLAAAVALSTAGAALAKTYFGVVGPGRTIILKNGQGNKVNQINAGRHTIKVDDNASLHNFHLLRNGINKKTTVRFVGEERGR